MINDDAPDTAADDDLFDDIDFAELPPVGGYRLSTRRDVSNAGSTVAPHAAG